MGKFTLREHLAGLRKNDQLLLMLVMSFLLINVFNIRGGGYMYFITYVLQGSTGYTSLFFTMVTFAAILGAVIVNPLSRRLIPSNSTTTPTWCWPRSRRDVVPARRAGVPDALAGCDSEQRRHPRLYPAAALFADGLCRRLRRMENRRALIRHELRLQPVFHQAGMGLQRRDYQPGVYRRGLSAGAGNQTPHLCKASPPWRHCSLPFSICCWLSVFAGADSTIQ
jgi:hypothetical protein